jgi:hypothetical protein
MHVLNIYLLGESLYVQDFLGQFDLGAETLEYHQPGRAQEIAMEVSGIHDQIMMIIHAMW